MLFQLTYDSGTIGVEKFTTIAEQDYQDQIEIMYAALFGTSDNTS